MRTVKFRTNIIDDAAIEKVKPFLNNIAGIKEWHFDNDNSTKILTVKAGEPTNSQIMNAIFTAGFRSELIQPAWKKIIKIFYEKDCCK